MDDTKLFLKITEEKYERFLENYSPDKSDFFTLEQQSLLAPFLSRTRKDGVMLWGGYEEAERKLALFMPDYTEVTGPESALEYFSENPDACPLLILELRIPSQEKVTLSHRDYLGALMGEGIRREKVGDIIVKPNGAQIIVKRELADYLLENLRQVGRASLTGKLLPISALDTGEIKTVTEKCSVASPRLDNVTSAAFSLSRKNAAEAISRGIVFVDGVSVTKPDHSLKGGEKLVLRGKGKVIYNGETGTSKKGKAYISVTKYL